MPLLPSRGTSPIKPSEAPTIVLGSGTGAAVPIMKMLSKKMFSSEPDRKAATSKLSKSMLSPTSKKMVLYPSLLKLPIPQAREIAMAGFSYTRKLKKLKTDHFLRLDGVGGGLVLPSNKKGAQLNENKSY